MSKLGSFTFIFLVLLISSKDLKVAVNDRVLEVMKDIQFTKLLRGVYEINHKVNFFLSIESVYINKISEPRDFQIIRFASGSINIRFQDVTAKAVLIVKLFGQNVHVEVEALISAQLTVGFKANKIEVFGVNYNIKELFLFEHNNPISNIFWNLIKSTIMNLNLFPKEKDNINNKINEILHKNKLIEINGKSIDMSLNSIDQYQYNNLSKSIIVFDLNTKFSNEQQELSNDISVPDLTFETDISIIASKEYLLRWAKLELIPDFDNDILKLRVDIINIELIQATSSIKVDLNAYVTPKRGKESIKHLTLLLHVKNIENDIEDLQITFEIEGMDFIMKTLYKTAKLEDKINQAIKKLVDEAKTFTDDFIKKCFWENLFTGKASIHIYDDKIMASYQIILK